MSLEESACKRIGVDSRKTVIVGYRVVRTMRGDECMAPLFFKTKELAEKFIAECEKTRKFDDNEEERLHDLEYMKMTEVRMIE